MLRIKLVRRGKKDRPTWRVVVVERKKTGKGKVAEYIGNYNPHIMPKEFKLNLERFEHWIKVGAQPTDAVLRLKGKYIDKNKEYQKLVKPKIYKKKVKKEEEAGEKKAELKEIGEKDKEEKEGAKAVAEGESKEEAKEKKEPKEKEKTEEAEDVKEEEKKEKTEEKSEKKE